MTLRFPQRLMYLIEDIFENLKILGKKILLVIFLIMANKLLLFMIFIIIIKLNYYNFIYVKDNSVLFLKIKFY